MPGQHTIKINLINIRQTFNLATRFGRETINPIQKFTSMNLLQMQHEVIKKCSEKNGFVNIKELGWE